MTPQAELLQLAERCERISTKLDGVFENRARMNAGAQATAIAMIVTLDLNLFDEVAAALRAAARSESST